MRSSGGPGRIALVGLVLLSVFAAAEDTPSKAQQLFEGIKTRGELAEEGHEHVLVADAGIAPAAAAAVSHEPAKGPEVTVSGYWHNRWPVGKDAVDPSSLQYPQYMDGLGVGVAVPIGRGGGYYHVAVNSLRMAAVDAGGAVVNGGFSGYRVAPIGIGWWKGIRLWTRGVKQRPFIDAQIDLGGLIALDAEYLSGSRALHYATQPSLTFGAGILGHLGLAFGRPSFQFAFGLAGGFDRRIVSFQDAGVAVSDAFAMSFVLRPYAELRLGTF